MNELIRTERLRLRAWRQEDLEPFAALNADPEVMEFLPKCLERHESDALAERFRDQLARRGYGRWAVEIPGVASFIGFVGLNDVNFDVPFAPCVEVGWRLAREHWGKGFASEAARASIRFGFEQVGLEEIVSFTVPNNVRSQAVMARVGMSRSAEEDFDHPILPVGHALRRHVLYRIQRGAGLSD